MLHHKATPAGVQHQYAHAPPPLLYFAFVSGSFLVENSNSTISPNIEKSTMITTRSKNPHFIGSSSDLSAHHFSLSGQTASNASVQQGKLLKPGIELSFF
jgi:hypothetical protein